MKTWQARLNQRMRTQGTGDQRREPRTERVGGWGRRGKGQPGDRGPSWERGTEEGDAKVKES